MPERPSAEMVRHVANLARLDVTDAEVEEFTGQLGDVLDYAAEIDRLAIDDVPPATHAVPVTNVFREDVVVACLDRDAALAGAPASEDGRFRVPRILGEEP